MHTPIPGIQAVAFDFGGVLADFIDTNEMRRLAEVAQVPCEPFNEAWSKHRNRFDSDEVDVAGYWSLVLDSCGSSVPRDTAIPLLQRSIPMDSPTCEAMCCSGWRSSIFPVW